MLIAHGDANGGYSLYLQSGHLVHDMNIGGEHVIVQVGSCRYRRGSTGSASVSVVSRESRH